MGISYVFIFLAYAREVVKLQTVPVTLHRHDYL